MNRINAVFIAIGVCLVLQVRAGGTIRGKIQASAKKMVNAVVYIEEVKQTFPPPAKHEVMDQKNLVFEPHVLPVLQGTTIDFLNGDNVRHNVFSPSHEKYNLGTWPTGEIKSRVFDQPGVYVQLCNVHAEMEGFIVVLQNPYFYLTKKDGGFEIPGVPVGEYVLKIWHEKLKKPQEKKTTVAEGKEIVVEFAY